MTRTEHSPVRVPRPRTAPAARLACFPHAGGTAGAFAALAAALPDDIEVLALQYPGRQERRPEPCAAGIPELAAEAAHFLAPYTGGPLFLLGHSMGALVAFETTRLLERRGPVAGLLVSAARPPGDDWQERDLDTVDDERIVAELRRLGGVPEPLLAEADVVREILRLLRADHRALRRYRCPPGARVTTPVTALHADADPKNTMAQTRGWARYAAGGFGTAVLSGGHFALTGRDPGAARLLTRLLRTAPAPAAPARPAG
ncbi:thioesterase II family protein [Streptomyces aidingensis]|uniref:Medium-chain acyl-[acyl-carrier-protein] hydrolase n=1 Tax=Streptomyces aidingensis TaxID=910347 RepID=A0A1I1T9I7_9ACTN|nr:alpha/beta fold hydrolase [Streptomyces aidingensis]SFD52973.1 medium-chain acyl-[acyl-carrier-protein] hydrolase [Streptomyces aidingensis]